MITAQRVLAAVALAAGATALAAPAASAAHSDVPGALSLTHELDSLATGSVAPEHRDELPTPSQQLNGLNRLAGVPHDLDPLTSQLAPVTGLLGS
ncbi:hypothetical protein [Streptomyces genisteinicus]|uniref:Secreted protein n=1 Tax=Streptomyces genisteinicus TaxID=2768068 RepID=A0A7H0HY39_9ACTN|nr:hypothetical protein [Streptomyces genisteinicus]QNP65455.1 hypothetical protein IAG43_22670 [Streptomyces genisteinicus]